jgi:hypothetical protein
VGSSDVGLFGGPAWGTSWPRPTRRAGWAGASFPHSGDAEGYWDAAGPMWRTTADHQDIGRRRDRRGERIPSRRPSPFPPDHLRNHQHMKETVEAINEKRSRNGEFVSPSLRSVSERLGRIATAVPGTRRELTSARSHRCHPDADGSGRLALIAWFDMTYLGGARLGPVRVIAEDFARGGRTGRDQSPRIGPGGMGPAGWIEATGREAGHLGSRAGYYGITRNPGAVGPQGASSSSPRADIRSDRPSARSLSRSVFRVIPSSRAAWSLLPSVDPSTSGRSSRSRCWCASW